MKRVPMGILVIMGLLSLILTACAASPVAPSPAPAASPDPADPKASATTAPSASATAPAPGATSVKPIELRYAHQNPQVGRTTVEHLNAWAKKVEDATRGRVKVTMFPSESLCKAEESLEACRSGLTDITWIIGGYFPGRFPLTEVMSLPFVGMPGGKIGNRELGGGAANSHIIQELFDTSPEVQKEWSDYKVLYLHTSDPFFLLTTKKAVKNTNDLSGLKVRELGGPPSDMWKLLGASPLMKPMPDLYDMLQKGVIDGTGISWASVLTYKLYEVSRYYTDAPTTMSFFGVIMNKDTWNGLSKDIQDQIMTVSSMAGAEFAGEAQFGNVVRQQTLSTAEKAGSKLEGVMLDPGIYDQWVAKAGKPIWDKWVADKNAKGLAGQKVMDSVLSLLQKYKK